jgi:hypothetical protein
MGRSMNITMLVIKNTAALDFAAPILCKVREERPDANVSVVYCALSRRKFLRRSKFFDSVLSKSGVRQYDFADFLRPPYRSFAGLWRRMCSKSGRDSSPWDARLGRLPGGRRVARYVRNSLKRLEDALTCRAEVQQVLPSLAPDVVLFDNTIVTRFHGRDKFYAFLAEAQKKVVLLPHAAHHASVTAFAPFNETGEALPDYCEFWMPFKFDRTWEALPERKSQFAYVGYPGLDSEWLRRFKPNGPRPPDNGPLRCLFIIRRFQRKGEARIDNDFIYSYDEFLHYLTLLKAALEEAGTDVEVIVKPHPSNDFEALKAVFAESGISRWRITHDSIYSGLAEVDFVISLYSTILFVPAMVGIPVVLLHSSTQSIVHQEETMEQLYTGLRFYLEDPTELPARLGEVVDLVREQRRQGEIVCTRDIEHLRQFYPDGATGRCLDRMGV